MDLEGKKEHFVQKEVIKKGEMGYHRELPSKGADGQKKVWLWRGAVGWKRWAPCRI